MNWLSVFLAALVPMVMGFIYYHKAVLGKPWMEATGMTEEKAASANMPVVLGISYVMSLILAFFLVGFCNGAGQEGEFDSFGHGAFHGAIIGIFIVLPVFVTNGLFEQHSWKLIIINSVYWIITIALMGGIVDAMNHLPNDGSGM